MAFSAFDRHDTRYTDRAVRQTDCQATTADEDVSGGVDKTLIAAKITSADTTQRYLKLYDATTADSSSTPDVVIPVISSSTRAVTTVVIGDGLQFSTGISMRCSDIADNANTDPASSIEVALVVT